MTKTILITSGRDGVGKTNIAVNAALEISQQNFRTCLLDTDLALAGTNTFSGLPTDTTLDSFISGEKSLEEIIYHSKRGIDIICGSSGIENPGRLNSDKISEITSSFSRIEPYDYFIIDISSGISHSLLGFCLAATETILVITSEATSLTEAYLLLRVMALNGYKKTVKVVVNKCPTIPISKRTYLRFETVVTKGLDIKMALAGILLNDPNMKAAAREQKPLLTLYPNSIASQCIRAMVSTLSEDATPKEYKTDFGEFWQNYFDFSRTDLLLTVQLPGNDAPESSFLPEGRQNIRFSPLTRIVPFSQSGGIINPLKLASPVTLLTKSLELQARGELSKNGLLKIFCSDPALMVRAMQMFSSAETGRPKRLTRISQIFRQLGVETLSNLLTTTAIQRTLTDQVVPDNRFLNTSWYYSYKTGLLAEQIAEVTDYPYPEEAFLAGLIHDIGRLALQTEYPQVYAEFPYTLRNKEIILRTERRIFGRTHAEIGAGTLRAYRLNNSIVDAVQYHTESESRIKTGFELVKIVFLASRLTQSSRENIQHYFDLGESLFGLTPDTLETATRKADKKLTETADHFHMVDANETESSAFEKTENHLKLQAVNYSLLRGALPRPAAAEKQPQILRLIHQGLDILFGIKASFLLMTDEQRSSLQAVGYPNCFGEEVLSNIVISFQSGNSLIVDAFTASELKISTDGKVDHPPSLADEQIKGILGSQVLVCVPMTAHAVSRGVIVFGIKPEELPNIHKQKKRLEQFGARSANTLCDSEQFLKRQEIQ